MNDPSLEVDLRVVFVLVHSKVSPSYCIVVLLAAHDSNLVLDGYCKETQYPIYTALVLAYFTGVRMSAENHNTRYTPPLRGAHWRLLTSWCYRSILWGSKAH